MTGRTRLRAGLFGLFFHAAAAGVVVVVATVNRVEVPVSFWVAAVPALLTGGALVYATMVAGYLARRTTRRGVIFYDSVVGMMAEVGTVAATSVLYALIV